MAKLKLIYGMYAAVIKLLNSRIHWMMKVWMFLLAPVLPMLSAPPESLSSALGRLLLYYLMLAVAVFVGLTISVWIVYRKGGSPHG